MSDSATVTSDQLRTVLISTELGGKAGDSSHFSYAKLASSSYSFGQMQFDVDANPAARAFLKDNGFDAADISKLRQHGGLSDAEKDVLDTKLQAIPQEKLNQFTSQQLSGNIGHVGDIIDDVRKLNLSAADAIVKDQKLQLGIADYANQFSPRHDGQLVGFLAGKQEFGVHAGNPPTRDDVQEFINATPWYGKDRANADGIAGRELHFNQAMAELGLGPAVQSHSRSSDHISHPGTLRAGDRGEAVGDVQQQLHDLGYKDAKGNPLPVDKDFGPSTDAAVKSFQQSQGLSADGIVGKDTASALTAQINALEKGQSNVPASIGITRDSSIHDMFEAICSAAANGDRDSLCAVGQTYMQSPQGQADLTMGVQMNQMQAQTQQAQQALLQPQTQVQQVPAMSR